MKCPDYGASNREGAAFCDSCGRSLTEVASQREDVPPLGWEEKYQDRSRGLVGPMTFDWTIRSALAGIAGITGAAIAAALGAWGFVVLFVLIAAVGWRGVFAYITSNPP
jgi:hypothetical protein